MNDEPYYVDDPFEEGELDLSTSGIEHLHIVEKAQKICRRPRNPFHSMKEKRKWIQIDKKITRAIIGPAWIENCFDWATEKNKDRLIILMPALASLILNAARMTDFNQKTAEEMGLVTDDERDLAEDGF